MLGLGSIHHHNQTLHEGRTPGQACSGIFKQEACYPLRRVGLSTMVNYERSRESLKAAPEAISESRDRQGQKEEDCVGGRKQKKDSLASQ